MRMPVPTAAPMRMMVSTAMRTIAVAPAEALHVAAAKSVPTLAAAATIGARTHMVASAAAEAAATTHVMAATAAAARAASATTSASAAATAPRVGGIKHTRRHEQGRRRRAQSKHLCRHEASPLAHLLSRADDLGSK
jgi:hypothetical protein